MGYDGDDLARDFHEADLADRALDRALQAAEGVSRSFTERWGGNRLMPEVSVRLTVGAEDQPLFVFSLRLALADDIDPHDVPWAEVEQLQWQLRSDISRSDVDQWDWIVTTETQATAAQR